ncbi:efflux RND transporter periplasmic adaptor subunit [Algoriphagus sp. CAU 1675]|uniref:efflux RND transporter periplasmic adaptor subunit n=1 Tax=Algoriphagus sp. CAU 1675 TaxID=3032597 RepID=UPI0023D9DE54|nr:efflux RND transporter periplasmic adaptor subunit [Algoriphagus sp. CAU 1675]MDF2158573.1 efflux RND transporter periplasmic adaptor subunit [Algoriphagus sp. CAU 1675]
MKKQLLTDFFSLLTLISFVSLAFLPSCGESESQVIHPEVRTITESVYASGLIKAKNQYEAFALGSGPIEEIFVSEGDTVEVGTPIMKIFSEREKLNRESAELARAYADLNANQSKLLDLELTIELAKSKMKNDSLLFIRQKSLWDQGIGKAIELEQRELAYINSKSAYESALLRYSDLKREIEFNSKSASKNLAISEALEDEYLLKSDIEGKVYSILKEKGEMVSPQTPLAVIGSSTEFILELQVDEYDIAKVKLGQKVIVRMDSYPDEIFEAEVSKIYPIMDSKSKSFTVEAEFITVPKSLYPNLTLEANVVTQTKENTLVIPRNYLFEEEKVITESEDTLQVKTGIKTYQYAEILEGIDTSTGLIPPVK